MIKGRLDRPFLVVITSGTKIALSLNGNAEATKSQTPDS
jgi:hypothetical protein